MTTRYPAHTLTHSDTAFVFVEVAGRMHVSEWFGDDLKDVLVMAKFQARNRWRALLRAGARVTERDGLVSPLYHGLSRKNVPADDLAAAWREVSAPGKAST